MKNYRLDKMSQKVKGVVIGGDRANAEHGATELPLPRVEQRDVF